MRQPHTSQVTPADETFLFIQTLSGKSACAKALYRRVTPYLRRRARHRAPDLPDDLIDDVVSEIWLIVIRRGKNAFDPSRGSVRSYLLCVLKEALRTVRSQYAPPGKPTRQRRSSKEHEVIGRPGSGCISISLDEASHDQCSPLAYNDPIEERVDATMILEGLSDPFREYLGRVYLRGETRQEVSDDLGISRFQFHRRFKEFSSCVRNELENAA